MKLIIPSGEAVVVVTTALATYNLSGVAPPEPAEQDAVLASFECNLIYQPAPPKRVLRQSIEEDELHGMLNRVHWTRANPTGNDAIRAATAKVVDALKLRLLADRPDIREYNAEAYALAGISGRYRKGG